MTFQGKFNFSLNLDLEESLLKRNNIWSYSESLNKLYVKYMSPCRIGLNFSQDVPPTSIIRLYAEYRPSDAIEEPVVRCQKHAKNSQDPHLFPDHVIRCDYPHASYLCDAGTQVRSISVPVSALSKERDCHILEFKYVCYSSCLSKRGTIHSVFVLQDGGKVLGNCSVETRVCASPSRDLKLDEMKTSSQKRELSEVAPPGRETFSLSPPESVGRGTKRMIKLVERWLDISNGTAENGLDIVTEPLTPLMGSESWNDTMSSQSSQHSITTPTRKSFDRPPAFNDSKFPARTNRISTPTNIPSNSTKPDLLPITNHHPHNGAEATGIHPLQFKLYTKPDQDSNTALPSLHRPFSPFDSTHLNTNGHANSNTYPHNPLASHYHPMYGLDEYSRGITRSFDLAMNGGYRPAYSPYVPRPHSNYFSNGSSPSHQAIVSPSKKLILDQDEQNLSTSHNGLDDVVLEDTALSQQTNQTSSQMSLN